MLKYSTFAAKNSMYNTPPCFAVYTVQLVLKWLEETIGGLEKMAAINQNKAQLLYGYMDGSGFYRATAEADSRSLMNVTFRLPNEDLEKQFVEQALANGLGGLKGHRSVGGCRASIYNAITLEAVQALVGFMKAFEKEKGSGFSQAAGSRSVFVSGGHLEGSNIKLYLSLIKSIQLQTLEIADRSSLHLATHHSESVTRRLQCASRNAEP
jgi:hypothetical protein